MGTIIRWGVAALLGFSLLPWSVILLARVWTARPGAPDDAFGCLAGAVLAVVLVVWRKPNRFVHTLIHEACHALVCAVLGVRISRFSASDGSGGEVCHRKVDPVRTLFIGIAPYTVPLLLGPVLLLDDLVPVRGPWRTIWSALVVLLYVHHLVGLGRNLRLNFWGKEGDLAKVGRPLAVVIILSVLALVTAWTVVALW